MRKEVLISIQGKEFYPEDKEENVTKMVTEGKYYKKGNKHFLSYQETEMTGLGKTTTTLKIDENTVAVTRFGEVNSHMVFKSGEKHTGHYDTPVGSFTVGVVSDAVKVDIGEKSGTIDIHYTLEIDNSTKAEHSLCLQVQEV